MEGKECGEVSGEEGERGRGALYVGKGGGENNE